ncbi:molybdopterin converting factor subunit 1 [Acuticoccus sp.]|uniref:molybdopterin converting factor subunit 1 n=1 Tax=Acuticoccus sp. TaxID=1904378 RepID=UPI003B52BB1D
MKLKYFAWVRERVGLAEEDVTLPDGVDTGAELIAWLRGRGEGYERAFHEEGVIRVAVDRRHVAHEAPVRGAAEVALFPPMTGG